MFTNTLGYHGFTQTHSKKACETTPRFKSRYCCGLQHRSSPFLHWKTSIRTHPGDRRIPPHRISDFAKVGFLKELEQLLPEHIYCEACSKLHSMANAKQHIPSRRPCDYGDAIVPECIPEYRDMNRHWLQCWINNGDDL